jgi:hypothetical protein
MAKANSSVSIEVVGTVLTAAVRGFAPLVMDMATMPDELNQIACGHGYKQKFGDAAAIQKTAENGFKVSDEMRYNAIKAVFDRVTVDHDWNAEREGGGAESMLFEALTLMMPDQTAEHIRGVLDGLTAHEKTRLPFDPEVAPFYKSVRDARDAKKAKGVDTKAVLSKFKQ